MFMISKRCEARKFSYSTYQLKKKQKTKKKHILKKILGTHFPLATLLQ